MAPHALLLISLVGLTLLGAPSSPARAAAPLCVRCHRPHYAELDTCTGCHRGDAAAVRPALAHAGLIAPRYAVFGLPDAPAPRRGDALVDLLGCRRCHTLGARGTTRASDLDASARRASPPALDQALATPASVMPDFQLSPAQRVDVVTALLRSATRAPANAGRAPQKVFFSSPEAAADAFTRECGRCHQLLSASAGALGHGRLAPNLSGLFTPYAEPVAPGVPGVPGIPGIPGIRWTEAELRRWLENPRALRPTTTMPPVTLDPPTVDAIVSVLAELPSAPRLRAPAAGPAPPSAASP